MVFLCIFETFGAKNAINTDAFCASEAPNHGIPGNKNHSIYSVFVPIPDKNTVIYAVFSMLQGVSFYLRAAAPAADPGKECECTM